MVAFSMSHLSMNKNTSSAEVGILNSPSNSSQVTEFSDVSSMLFPSQHTSIMMKKKKKKEEKEEVASSTIIIRTIW
ncbi:hypothetical protein KI387_002702, partial [Taxus chinensis]